MAIFNSYVKLPEAKYSQVVPGRPQQLIPQHFRHDLRLSHALQGAAAVLLNGNDHRVLRGHKGVIRYSLDHILHPDGWKISDR